MTEDQAIIIASCNVSRIATAYGGGFRLTLDLPEIDFITVAKLLPLYQKNVGIVITPEIE